MSENMSLQPNVALPHPDRQVDNLHHLERIAAAMAPDPREYEYRGIVNDLGQMSGKCACGHAIRYEFLVHHSKSNKTVVIGSVCIDSSIPWLVANGADRLAEQLRDALEANEDAKKEALKQLRDAKNDAEVQALEAYYAGLSDWHAQARREYREARQGQYWLPEFLYRKVPTIKAMTTPGRTASSIRTKIVKLALAAMEAGVEFPKLPDDEKLRAKVEKELTDKIVYAKRRADSCVRWWQSDRKDGRDFTYSARQVEEANQALAKVVVKVEQFKAMVF